MEGGVKEEDFGEVENSAWLNLVNESMTLETLAFEHFQYGASRHFRRQDTLGLVENFYGVGAAKQSPWIPS